MAAKPSWSPGVDDHSRFVVIAAVVVEPTARVVCEAVIAAMATCGVSSEVLTDNGKQFTGRFIKPHPAEVLFERICRENGIRTRLTKPRSPTTTGKIERWHKTLRRDFLDAAWPFPDLETAQAATWVAANGRVMVAGQRLRAGRTYAGQTVVIALEDTVFRVFLNNVELSTLARQPDLPITRFKAYPRRQNS